MRRIIPFQPSDDTMSIMTAERVSATPIDKKVAAVPLLALQPGESPRLQGEDKNHIRRLAESEAELPPILVHWNTMRVIDGMHRLMAASLQGRETIDVVFCDGDEADLFLRAVEENVKHGLPLSRSDRRAAAERIIDTHPHMSDRAIGQSSGLAAKTVAAIRKRLTGKAPQSNKRVGLDGKIRPLDSSEGRRRAAQMLADQPEASLRDVARATGIAPATVLDVRNRLLHGELPQREERNSSLRDEFLPDDASGTNGRQPEDTSSGRAEAGTHPCDPAPVTTRPGQPSTPSSRSRSPSRSLDADAAATVNKLLRDPAFRNDQGRELLRLLHANAVAAEQLCHIGPAIPPHCVAIVARLAHQYAQLWQDFAIEQDGRARIIDPSTLHGS
jgi:ParB-like chromosome segregation protein Spo0J